MKLKKNIIVQSKTISETFRDSQKDYRIGLILILTDLKIPSWQGIDVIMIISVMVYMLTNYLGMPLIYMTADCFFYESVGVYVNVKLGIL